MPAAPNESGVEHYRAMWDSSPLAVLVCRGESVVYATPAALKLFEVDVVGQPLQCICPSEEPEENLSGTQTLKTATGKLLQADIARWNTNSGDLVVLLQHYSSRDKLREALLHSAEMESILASIADGVYVGDRQGIYICNRPALDMLGFDSPDQLKESVGHLAQRIQTRVPETGEPLGADEQPFTCALRGEQTIREVLIHHLKTGRDVLVRCAAAPVYLDGKIIAAVAVNTDITETRKIERKLRETESLAAVGRLAWQVAHEINNPLQAATNLLTLAADDRVPPETQRDYVTQAQAQLKRTADVLIKVIGLHKNQS